MVEMQQILIVSNTDSPISVYYVKGTDKSKVYCVHDNVQKKI